MVRDKPNNPTMRSFLLLLLAIGHSRAFVPVHGPRRASGIFMAPKFDKKTQRWSPGSPEEGPEAGYPVINTLLNHGPNPAFQRIFAADDYDQAVLKFMAGDKCSRDVAQGNMDRYLDNPNDWAYERMEAQKTGFYRDYVTLEVKQVILSLAWSVILFSYVGAFIYSYQTGNSFSETLGSLLSSS